MAFSPSPPSTSMPIYIKYIYFFRLSIAFTGSQAYIYFNVRKCARTSYTQKICGNRVWIRMDMVTKPLCIPITHICIKRILLKLEKRQYNNKKKTNASSCTCVGLVAMYLKKKWKWIVKPCVRAMNFIALCNWLFVMKLDFFYQQFNKFKYICAHLYF